MSVEAGKLPAYRLFRQTQIVGYIAAAHRQGHQFCVVGFTHARSPVNIGKKTRQPFSRRLTSQHDDPLMCHSQFTRYATVSCIGERRIAAGKALEPAFEKAAQFCIAHGLGTEVMSFTCFQAEKISRKKKGDHLPAPVQKDRIELDNATGEAEYAIR